MGRNSQLHHKGVEVMGSLQHIFAKPEYIEGINKDNPIILYPIILDDYDKFEQNSNLLYLSKDQFIKSEIPLFLLLLVSHEQIVQDAEDGKTLEKLITQFSDMFSLITKEQVTFIADGDDSGFLIDDTNMISAQNYDKIRKAIMYQNLMFEPKVYEDPIVQEWVDKKLKVMQRQSGKITLEDMITTVKNYDGLTYEQIMKQSIYQLYSDFYRIGSIMGFWQSSLFSTVSSEKIKIEHFAAAINVRKSPYDVLVDSDKLNSLNSVMGS